jgi:RecJ-like exonuclease
MLSTYQGQVQQSRIAMRMDGMVIRIHSNNIKINRTKLPTLFSMKDQQASILLIVEE